ncbi:MAG: ring-hydroxylating diogenase 2Fe-2S ferredoxin subunit [Phormidesmis priestleyi Ana]|uniref:Ring-hydroxylating diogenase 2Fe-2S ferredoxin subunit n=1 Tax=Phormidesmis priestleyi Ana TaxID=1666911 RepID=A0A0N8KNW1_9CYAN|nr:MAG: ring-hydroxylating diogenase 2Fe-2S ferredoxin subunit [Phormidesmis priestleyi Ana]
MVKAKIAIASDISTDKVLKATANGKAVLVAKVGDSYCAIDNKCPHLGLPMAKGKFENGIITCPFHGSKFEICTGKNVEWVDSFAGIPLPGVAKKMMAMGKSPTDAPSFAVTQEGNDLFIEV